MKLQPAVKTETIKVAKAEAVGVLLMFAVFFVLHLLFPNAVPFDYRVILAGIIGGCVAVANFLLMGISIQKMTDAGDVDTGKAVFKSGYRKRMLLQILWGIAALVAAEDAIYLARTCNKVYLVHRRDKLRAANVLAEQIEKTDNIEIIWNSTVNEILGEDEVEVQ